MLASTSLDYTDTDLARRANMHNQAPPGARVRAELYFLAAYYNCHNVY
jgi:hypothetical protein